MQFNLQNSLLIGLEIKRKSRTFKKPNSWPDIRKNLVDNSIRLLVDDRYPIGFIATITGGYSVDIDGEHYADYNSEAQFSMADWSEYSATDGYAIDYPTGATKAHIIDIYPQTNGNNITAFKCMRVAESGNEEQGVLWAHLNLTNTINLARGFAYDGGNNNPLMEALTAKNNLVKVNGLSVCFYNNTSLSYVPTIDGQNNTMEIYGLFYRTAIKKVDIKNLKFAEGSIAFYSCYNLEELPKGIDYSDATNMSYFLFYNYALKDTVLDVSAATGLTRIGLNGTTGIKGLRVSNSAPFSSSTPQIDIRETGLDRTALVQLFNDLPTVSDGQIINITGCTGTTDLSDEDKTIATAKGWTIAE